MKRILLTLVFLLLAAGAEAQTQTARFTVNWQASTVLPDGSNAPTGYKLERATGTSGTFSQITQTAANVLTFADSIINDAGGITYCYRVRATNAVGDSGYSNTACGTSPVVPKAPNPPSGLTVTAISSSQIRLTWRDNSTNETGFQTERNGRINDSYAMNTTTAVDGSLQPRTWYTYRIRALGEGGNSGWSESVKTKTFR